MDDTPFVRDEELAPSVLCGRELDPLSSSDMEDVQDVVPMQAVSTPQQRS